MRSKAMEGLTTRQAEILDFIRENIEHTGMAPTRAEVALRFGFKSKNAAADHLRALEQKGHIKLHPELSRGIQLLDEQDPDLIPVIGSVAAGLPIEAIENHDEALPVPKGLFAKRPTYLLRVKGDSMKDAGILEGDLIAVYKTNIARKGQIVVARMNNEVTVKYLDSEGSHMKLVPANPSYQPMLIAPEDLVIEGVFVGLIRDSFGY
ncbi:MAG TPA: LexA repressor [Moraxellaceae bacterium]|nr:LexA repressor [Moraxellaceae bacterium]